MKTGFRTVGFSKWNIFDALKKIKEIGYEGVELCLEHPDMQSEKMDDEMIADVRRYLDGIGLEIASVSYHGDNDPLDVKISNTYKAIDIANKIGASILIINCEKKSNEVAGQYESLVKRMKDFASYAEQRGIVLAFEPEPLLIIQTVDDMIRLMDDVCSDNLKVNMDVGHTYITDPDLPEAILKLKDKIVHVHLEDIKNKVHSHLYPLDGDIDYKKMFHAFEEIGYNGYYVIDMFYIQEAPDVHAKVCFDRLQKLS
ncbi:Sugar phosphate isomerase/epimerase [Caldanaerobius fijiensis DSM 17918]|uniref:Sugar phosphate isomerase/epimerase n=1 Tax=Caldanaerobius fijiensis DSM 17918 TaxID=1121256 RepID=A0A1M5B4X2_9THEO|nr:sugar phosphate isomerase/epimerase family protein [Caldanaerobius fijiensis]SHF37554.1 Sugar phosphate isomerase/epimerase [Caldanaerobius fijiensis DSM 17918]